MEVAVYTRTDNEGQAELYISSQLEKIQKYCDENGLHIGNVYTDVGYSGISMERPQLLHLLSDSENGLFDGVVVYDRSRLTRNVADFLTIKSTLQNKGVKLLVCSEPDNIQENFLADFLNSLKDKEFMQ